MNRGIFARILLSLILLFLISTSFVGYILLTEARNTVENSRLRQANTLVKGLAEGSLDALASNDYELLERWLVAATPIDDFAFAYFSRSDGVIISHTQNALVATKITPLSEVKFPFIKNWVYLDRPVREIAYPAQLGNRVLAYAHIGYYVDTKPFYSEDIVVNIISILVMSLLILAGVTFFVLRYLLKPIETLAGVIGETTGYSSDLPGELFERKDEVGLLARNFNELMGRLSNSYNSLYKEKEFNQVTLDSIADAVVVTDDKGLIQYLNSVAEQLTGWTSAEARGEPVHKIFSIIDSTTQEMIPNPVDKVLATGETVYLSNHTTLISRDGTEYHIADSAAPIRNEEKQILGMVLVFNDISEQYRLREELRKSSQQVISILDRVADAYVVLDQDWCVLYMNTETERMLKTERKVMQGKNFWDEFPELSSYFYTKLRHCMEDDQAVKFEGYYPLTEQWLEANAYPADDQLYLYFRDITQRKKMDDELSNHRQLLEQQVHERTLELEQKASDLARATQLKSEFLANMSHELRTPMNSIIGFTGRVIKKSADKLDPRQLNNLHIVERNAHHLLGLINGLLDLSKIEAGKMEIYKETFELEALIREVFSLTGSMLDGKPVELKTEILSGDIRLNTDSVKLKQILINLVSNAIKFTQQGSITIEAEQDPEKHGEELIAIRVIDTGVGMDESALQYIFEAFRQVDGSMTRKAGGTGLGLAIVRSFTELLGGTIRVESEVGAGTRFELLIPVSLNRVESEFIQPSEDEEPYDIEKRTILCIDDEEEARELLSDYLNDEGYRVVMARSGEEGLALARQIKPFAITLDILMPGKDGWRILEKLKSAEETRDIPVLVISVLDNQALGYRMGAFDYMQKPIDPERLIRSIGKLA